MEMKNISKNFGGILALNNVSLKLYEGEILALVGDNGAGKSTQIKILSGVFPPAEGEIIINGEKVDINSYNRRKAKRLGIEAVYQDLALVDSLDAPTNVFLGEEKVKNVLGLKFLDKLAMARETLKLLETLKVRIQNIYQPVYNLSGGQKQSVAIGRALRKTISLRGCLILDEPTAALGAEESEKTLSLIRSLRDQGLSIIIIAHNLEHIFRVANRIAVLRRGELVGIRKTEETDKGEIVGMIIGAT